MANDVAKLIWDMAKNDKTLDGLSLKQMFKHKVNIDADELKKRLKVIVEEQIKTEIQPCKSEITLSSDTTKTRFIFGATACAVRRTASTGNPIPGKYIFVLDNAGSYLEVTNMETRMLIDSAIIPLDLKWKLDLSNMVIVSWKHWIE